MTYEAKNIIFHVIHVKVSRCSRTSPMKVAIESGHCDSERNPCKHWVCLKMCRTTREREIKAVS